MIHEVYLKVTVNRENLPDFLSDNLYPRQRLVYFVNILPIDYLQSDGKHQTFQCRTVLYYAKKAVELPRYCYKRRNRINNISSDSINNFKTEIRSANLNEKNSADLTSDPNKNRIIENVSTTAKQNHLSRKKVKFNKKIKHRKNRVDHSWNYKIN